MITWAAYNSVGNVETWNAISNGRSSFSPCVSNSLTAKLAGWDFTTLFKTIGLNKYYRCQYYRWNKQNTIESCSVENPTPSSQRLSAFKYLSMIHSQLLDLSLNRSAFWFVVKIFCPTEWEQRRGSWMKRQLISNLVEVKSVRFAKDFSSRAQVTIVTHNTLSF